MMTETVPFKAEHGLFLQNLVFDGNDSAKRLTNEQFLNVEQDGNAKSFFVDGIIYACGGHVEYHPNRCVIWSIVRKDVSEKFFSVAKAMKLFVDALPHKRIESTVKTDFAEGHRLNAFLGFTEEIKEMKYYGFDGSSYTLYSRIK